MMNRKAGMTAISTILAMTLAWGSAIAGQSDSGRDKHFGRHSAENHIRRLAESLDLSDQQSAEVLAVLQTAEAERRVLHQEIMEAARPEICAQRAATHAEILAILNEEQAAQFEAMLTEHKNRAFGRGPRGGLMDLDCQETG